ncbi:MAG TPA: MBL fold metallo-hydrolase [Anaerolineae bacterium]|jgi:glyoxylase-like metal-dependent hydrolase (beta-lactamase superfamily II)|nr:MBL fold metallo-hydrolase [Anaerolineae bacterium]
MELLARLHWIEGRASNIYLWQGDAGLLMFDTGMPGDAKKILAYIDEAGFRPADVMAILITHADKDHAGGAAELSDHCQAPVYASSATAELLMAGESPKHLPRLIQFIADHFMGYNPVAADGIQIVEDGQSQPELHEWQIMATPGHCADHHSFCSPVHGILFAGDALSTRGDRLQLNNKFITADQAAARKSARRLLQLTPAVFACGHGRPMTDHNAEDLMMLSQELRSVEALERNARPEGATGG